MTINRNLSILAESAGAQNKPTLNLTNLGEVTTVVASAATGTINFDVLTQSVLYYTANASANWTLNVRGSSTAAFSSFISVGQSVDIKFFVTNGATAYVPSAFQIDGSAVTVNWAGGSAPTSGTANAIDEYSYTIICTAAGVYTVMGDASVASGGGGGLTIGTTAITGGTSGRVLYNNANVVGELSVSGTGNAVLATTPTITGLNETRTTITTGAATINCAAGNVFSVSLNANITGITLSNVPASGTAYSFTLSVTSAGTSNTIAWPASFKWPGGTAPTLTNTNGKVDTFVAYTFDGGTTWYAFTAGLNA